MRILMKPIEMIAWFTKDGKPSPIKYRLADGEGRNTVIKVDKLITREEEKLAGNRMVIFRCQSFIDGIERVYELKYEISTCKWFLFKM
ncbi:MAG: hypothetical protein ACOX7R_06555 [Acetivibrionales bacterium]|jgi:hypothetical protein